ncbi:hypothetical protein COOONC_11236 [Cooperia oncophora]
MSSDLLLLPSQQKVLLVLMVSVIRPPVEERRSQKSVEIKIESKPDENEKKASKRRTFPKKREHDVSASSFSGSLRGSEDVKTESKTDVPVDATRIAKHDTGVAALNPENMRSVFHKEKFAMKKRKLMQRSEKTARAELLNREEEGFIEGDEGEPTYVIRQKEIADAVDIANASKYFELHLENFGPYRISYTDNGRHLLIGGKKGHIAALDWQTKKLHCETNVMETVRDVQWLHTENLYAVAQRHYTYVYDNQGTELHCVKQFHEIRRLEFLPRHFLLVGSVSSTSPPKTCIVGQNKWFRWRFRFI